MVGEGYFGISIRNDRRTNRFKIQLLPQAAFGMNDVESMEVAAAYLKEVEMPFWFWRHKTKRYAQINIHGLGRLKVFLPWIIPVLTGAKKKSAENLHGYVQHRLSLPHQSPITEECLQFVERSRELNGAQGWKRTVDLDEVRRILRDYTSSLEQTPRFAQVKR